MAEDDVMTREDAAEWAALLKAYSAGATLQFNEGESEDGWRDVKDFSLTFENPKEWRVKPRGIEEGAE